jgi:hypothetical protein
MSCPECGGSGTIYTYVTPYRRMGRTCPACGGLPKVGGRHGRRRVVAFAVFGTAIFLFCIYYFLFSNPVPGGHGQGIDYHP